MAKLKVVSSNLVDAATVVATTTYGVYVANNLKSYKKSKVWRSTAKTATLTVTFTSPQVVDCVILPYCNLVATGTIRVILRDINSAAILNNGIQLASKWSLIGTSALNDIPTGIGTYSYGGGTCATIWLAAPVANVSSVQIIIDNSAATDTYIEAAGLIIGNSWTPKYNTSYGASVEFKDQSTSSRSESGDLVVTRSTKNKAIEFNLGFLDKDDKLSFTNILRRAGSSLPVFISVYPSDIDVNLEGLYQIYGMLSPTSLTNINFGLYSSQITVEEV